jgi:hypothetical protein
LFSPTHFISDLGQTKSQHADRKVKNDQPELKESYKAVNNDFKKLHKATMDKLHSNDLSAKDYFAPGKHCCHTSQYGRMKKVYDDDCQKYLRDNKSRN